MSQHLGLKAEELLEALVAHLAVTGGTNHLLFEDQVDLFGMSCATLFGGDAANVAPALLGAAVDDDTVISNG